MIFLSLAFWFLCEPSFLALVNPIPRVGTRLLSGDLLWGPPFTASFWVLSWLSLPVATVVVSFFVVRFGAVLCLCVLSSCLCVFGANACLRFRSRGAVLCLCVFVVNAWLGSCFPGRCFVFVCVCCECLAGVSFPGRCFMFVRVCRECLAGVSFPGRCFMFL